MMVGYELAVTYMILYCVHEKYQCIAIIFNISYIYIHIRKQLQSVRALGGALIGTFSGSLF